LANSALAWREASNRAGVQDPHWPGRLSCSRRADDLGSCQDQHDPEDLHRHWRSSSPWRARTAAVPDL